MCCTAGHVRVDPVVPLCVLRSEGKALHVSNIHAASMHAYLDHCTSDVFSYAGPHLVHLRSSRPQINDPANPSRKVDDFWGPSQGLLSESNFLAQLQEYDKDNIPPAVIALIR